MKNLILSAVFAVVAFTINAQIVTITTNSSEDYSITNTLNLDGSWNSDTILIANNIESSTYIFDFTELTLTSIINSKLSIDSIFIQNQTGIFSPDSVFRISINSFSDEFMINITKKTFNVITSIGYISYPNSIFYIKQ